MKHVVAKDIMSRDVIWVPDDWPVSEVAKLFIEKRISGSPVVSESGEMVGVVSLHDILQSSTGAEEERFDPQGDGGVDYYEQDWDQPLSNMAQESLQEGGMDEETSVRDVMNPLVYCMDERTPVAEIAEVMVRGRIHRVVITNKDELTGIVTSMDLIRLVRDFGM